ncbi:nitronate monooxygenase [Corynebacterium poyangense]|uniref:Propionate 3-nitronate monooxygenase n=1 Tax=Corynebacterium poyangense TaxID=2684405 RepID=A0A7H0SMY9_9CORY|nr:nitronate monooxygenase family protein [Corynebacterium poyangense]QNQ89914.1 nitronate monooxygenase [Corynebacterium poyangense]
MRAIKDLAYHIIAAPMAGGPSTPELAAAVSRAGGLGFLAFGTMALDAVEDSLTRMAELASDVPYGVNLFAPQRQEIPAAMAERVREELKADYASYGLEVPDLPDPDYSNGWEEKLQAALSAPHPPAVISSTFGCFSAEEIGRIHDRGISAWCTVTSVEEAQAANNIGVDALVVQGPEAGGHRGTWDLLRRPDTAELAKLLSQVHQACPDLPLVAAGGLSTPSAVAQAQEWSGVVAVAAGSAFLLTPEAGTSEVNREFLAEAAKKDEATLSTRAFSGRYARGLKTAFCQSHPDPDFPPVYPFLNQLLAPLRAEAGQHRDFRWAYCLVGQNCDDLKQWPAAKVMRWLAGENIN